MQSCASAMFVQPPMFIVYKHFLSHTLQCAGKIPEIFPVNITQTFTNLQDKYKDILKYCGIAVKNTS